MSYQKNKLYYATTLMITSLISANVMAAPKIIYKNSNNTASLENANSVPAELKRYIHDIGLKNADLYEMVVYPFKDHFVVYLLSGNSWEAKKVRIDMDTDGKIKNIIENYTGNETLANKNAEEPQCPDTSIQFLAISAYPNVAAVNESIKMVTEAAQKKYKTMSLLSSSADGKTYKNWLSCPNLKGIYSIGHGAENGMMVGNGDLVEANFFNSEALTNKYQNTTVIFNACLVYNNPIGPNILFGGQMTASGHAAHPGPNPHEYIGGHVNLLMYSSERSSACFMVKAIEGEVMSYDTLRKCIGNQDLYYQNFGLSNPNAHFIS